MKIIRINIISLILISNLAYSNELYAVKNSYINDANLYKQFIEIGNSVCLDRILKVNGFYNGKVDNYFFERHSETLGGLHSKFKEHYKWEDMRVIWSGFYDKYINDIVKKNKSKDEYFKLEYSSPIFICNELLNYKMEIKEIYRDFIDEYNLYNKK